MPPPWALVLSITAIAIGVNSAPVANWITDIAYLGMQAGSAVTGSVFIHRSSAPRGVARGWSIIAAGLFTYFLADALWVYYERTGQDPYPSVADAAFMAATLAMMAGATVLIRQRRMTVDRTATYDALVVAGAIASVLWVSTIEPALAGSDAPLLERLIGTTYPALDILLAVVVARLIIAGGRIPPAILLLLGGLILVTSADVAYYLQELTDSYTEGGWIDATWIASYGLMCAAMAHPSMARLADLPEPTAHLGRVRLAVLCTAAVTPLAVLLWTTRADGPRVVVLGGLAAALFAIVIIRSWTLVVHVESLTRQQGERRFDALVRHSADAIVLIDRDGHALRATDALRSTWGIDIDAPGTFAQWLHDTDRPTFAAFRRRLAELGPEETIRCRVRLQRGPDLGHAEVVGANLLADDSVRGIVLTIRDMTERIEFERELRHRAEHDALTGLVRREVLVRSLDEEQAAGRSVAVLFIDVDEFKSINDALGHAAGDMVLLEIATRLSAAVPHGRAARVGGDEFVVGLSDTTDVGEVRLAAEAVHRHLSAPVELPTGSVSIGVSVGYTPPTWDADGETMVRHADLAMYAVKRTGKRGVRAFTPELEDRVAIEVDLRRRLVRASLDGELHLVLQPIYDVGSGRIAMVEALLRWTHPERGEIPPAEFIPIAESSGLIEDIGGWVIDEAARMAALLPSHLAVAINVSAMQLSGTRLTGQISQALDVHGITPDRLVVEITESTVASADRRALLGHLRDRGLRIAIDDFGTGYSSLSVLGRFDVDVIKVDRSFLLDQTPGLPLVRTIVQLARQLGARTVIEGVETDRHLEAVLETGCDMVQGYAMARPMALPELLEVLQPGRTRSRA